MSMEDQPYQPCGCIDIDSFPTLYSFPLPNRPNFEVYNYISLYREFIDVHSIVFLVAFSNQSES